MHDGIKGHDVWWKADFCWSVTQGRLCSKDFIFEWPREGGCHRATLMHLVS